MSWFDRSVRSLTLLVGVLALLVGCGCSEKNDGTKDTDGGRPANEKAGAQAPPPRNYSRAIDGAYPVPADLQVGHWVERKLSERDGSTWTERVAVVAKTPDGAFWIEETDTRSVPGHSLVRRRLVRPDGVVLEAWIGYPGEKGERLQLVPAPPMLEGEPDEVADEQVTVAAGTFQARVETYRDDSEVVKVYRSDQVPYDHVVKRIEPEWTSELLLHGTDARESLTPAE